MTGFGLENKDIGQDGDFIPDNKPVIDSFLNEPPHYTYVDQPKKISDYILEKWQDNPNIDLDDFNISHPSEEFKQWLDSFWELQEITIREKTSRSKWEMEVKRHITAIIIHLKFPKPSDQFSDN